jgi:hypothetical protein
MATKKSKREWEEIRAEWTSGCAIWYLAEKHNISTRAIQQKKYVDGWEMPPAETQRFEDCESIKTNKRLKHYSDASNDIVTKMYMRAPRPSRYVKSDGWVYIARTIYEGRLLHKIGISKNPSKRFSSKDALHEITIICSFEVTNARETERELHKEFSEVNVRGEWFILTDEDLSYIVGKLETIHAQFLKEKTDGN